MTTIDRRGPIVKIVTRPQNSLYQFVRFVDSFDNESILDLSAYNMYGTVRVGDTNAAFLDGINPFWTNEIKVQRIARDNEGNSMKPLDTGIYLNLNVGEGNQPNGGDFILVINQFPNKLFPIGTYYFDWVIQYIHGQSEVLFTIEWTITNTIPETTSTEDGQFLKFPVSTLLPPPIYVGVKTMLIPQ